MSDAREFFAPSPFDEAVDRALEGLGPVCTVDALLDRGIFDGSRTQLYRACNQFITSDGRDGIPARRVGGRSIRILVPPLRRLLVTGHLDGNGSRR